MPQPETYFVIIGSEDGGCSVHQKTKDEVMKMLVPNQYGDYDYGEREALTELPRDVCNFNDMVIIKGRIVVPRPKETVTEYELE